MLVGLLVALVLTWIGYNRRIQHALSAHTLLNSKTRLRNSWNRSQETQKIRSISFNAAGTRGR